MKFEYLKEFVTAAQANEMQYAAKELGISPSVLSKHIKSLESEFGVPLFEHSGNTKLSKYGLIFLQYAIRLINMQNNFLSDNTESLLNETYELTVGISPAMLKDKVGQFLEECVIRGDNCFKVIETDDEKLSQMLASGGVDFAFIRSQPTLERDSRFVYMPFCRDQMVVAVSSEHHFAKLDRVHISELKNETVYLRKEDSIECALLSKLCLDHGVDPKIRFASAHYIYEQISTRNGVSLYPAKPINADFKGHLLVTVPLAPKATSFVDIVFKAENLSSYAIEFLNRAQEFSARKTVSQKTN